MAEEKQLSGEEWISDDSSFYGKCCLLRWLSKQSTLNAISVYHSPVLDYNLLSLTGDEEEQACQASLCQKANLQYFWATQSSDLNAALAPTRARLRSKSISLTALGSETTKMSLDGDDPDPVPQNRNASSFSLDRRAMEEARRARLGKRKREPSPEPELFNPAQGCHDAWQLGESVDDFVKRLPPLTTPISTCPWIWAHNPHRDSRDRSVSPREDEFRSRGRSLLDDSLQTRQQIQAKALHGPKAALHKSLSQESKALQQRITDLATECGILSGKVCAMFALNSNFHVSSCRKLSLGFPSIWCESLAKFTTYTRDSEHHLDAWLCVSTVANPKASGCYSRAWKTLHECGRRLSEPWSTTVSAPRSRLPPTKVLSAID